MYRTMYGNDGLDSRIMQEIAADAFAGRGGSFRQGVQRATERVREIVTKRKAETDNDRLVQQIADAVVQKLGLDWFSASGRKNGGPYYDEDIGDIILRERDMTEVTRTSAIRKEARKSVDSLNEMSPFSEGFEDRLRSDQTPIEDVLFEIADSLKGLTQKG